MEREGNRSNKMNTVWSGLSRELFQQEPESAPHSQREDENGEALKDKSEFFELPEEFGGKKVAVHEFGKADGPIVIAIHGWGANAIGQQNLFKNMSDYHVFAVDLPGFGDSEPLRSEDCHIERYVDALSYVTDQISAGQEIHAVMGHSVGSVIASKLVLERYQTQKDIAESCHAEKPKLLTKKLIFTGTPLDGVKDGSKLSNPLVSTLMSGVFESLTKLPKGLKRYKDSLDSKGIINPKNIDDRYIRRDSGMDGDAAVDIAEQLSRYNLRGLEPGEIEIAFLHGSNDRFTKPQEIVSYATEIGATSYVYDNAGHDVHYDALDKMSEDINDFLSR